MDELTRYNEQTYARLWQYSRYVPPEMTPWWPLSLRMAQGARDRLEIGPGPYPKLPVDGTHFIDLVPLALDMLRAHGGIVHLGELHELSFADKSFDLVGVFELLEHVEEDERLLAEIARITRPGGHLILALPLQMRLFNTWDQYAGHKRRYEPDELRDKLSRAGFELVEFETRPNQQGRLGAVIITLMCRFFPRFVMWYSDTVMVPLAQKWLKLTYYPASEWNARSAEAGECTVVCRRSV
jgi:SAM-dependent methyltransferase